MKVGEVPESSALRRLLARLGTYTEQISTGLNLRPNAATLLSMDSTRVEVRISTSSSHVKLVIAPEGDLAAEVAFLRLAAVQNLPIPRLISYDLSCSTIPFTYAIESYAGGMPLSRLEDQSLLRSAARQVGRTLRSLHQVSVPDFGRPTTTGRWSPRAWKMVLMEWLAQHDTFARAAHVLGDDGAAALRAATIDHTACIWETPYLIHGAIGPSHAIVTVGDGVHLEALNHPGNIIGGDPLFDLAWGLLPHRPAAFRQGLMEGYTARIPLSSEAMLRLDRLRLLVWVADVLWRSDEADAVELQANILSELATLA